MTMGEYIKILRKERGWSQEELGKKVGVNRAAVNKWENGTVENIKRSTIQQLATIFHVSPSELMCWPEEAENEMEARHTVPVYEAAAGEGRINDGYPTEEYNISLDDDQFLFEASGRSMEPTIMDGDMVVVAAQSVLDYPHQIALVKINGNEATLKRVEIKDDGLALVGDNTSVYPPHFFTAAEVTDLPVRIEGVVIKLIREMG